MLATDAETGETEINWPAVSLLILNWNGRALLESCLSPLTNLDYPTYEVVVVDNGSTDDSVAYVRERFPEVRLIETGENLGFSRGINFGLRRVEGDVVVLLNNDVVVLGEDWLAHLVRPLLSDKTIGIAGGKLLFPDRRTIQHAGGFLTEPLAYSKHTGHGELDEGQYEQARDTPYVTGAAMAIARRVLDEIGYLDERFHPFYYEEVDFCWRARAAGYRIRYVPEAVALHDESFSLRRASRVQHHAYRRNRLRFVLKHFPASQLLESFFPAERARLREEALVEIVALERDVYWEALRDLPQILAERGESELLEPFRAALLSLRKEALAVARATPITVESEIAELTRRHTLQSFKFRSRLPLLGPLVTAFRERWHAIAAKWAIRHLAQQQEHFNYLLVALLRKQMTASSIMEEKIYANATDLDTLLEELGALQHTLQEQTADIEQRVELLERGGSAAQLDSGSDDHNK